MAKRDPRDVLGVEPGASPTQIKAAWRRLARANHPDLTGDDPAASRLATRRMAEINDAYAALTRNADGAIAQRIGRAGRDAVRARCGSPPRRATRPETDPTGHRPRRHERRLPAAQPGPREQRGPDAAARPAAEGDRCRRPRSPARLDARPDRRPAAGCATSGGRRRPRWPLAEATVISFGKFHDHTLGQIAAFEPSYIDWVAGTVSHDPDLVSAARVIQADLDRRGDRPPDPSDTGSARPLRLRRVRPRLETAGKARSPPDTGRRP